MENEKNSIHVDRDLDRGNFIMPNLRNGNHSVNMWVHPAVVKMMDEKATLLGLSRTEYVLRAVGLMEPDIKALNKSDPRIYSEMGRLI